MRNILEQVGHAGAGLRGRDGTPNLGPRVELLVSQDLIRMNLLVEIIVAIVNWEGLWGFSGGMNPRKTFVLKLIIKPVYVPLVAFVDMLPREHKGMFNEGIGQLYERLKPMSRTIITK